VCVFLFCSLRLNTWWTVTAWERIFILPITFLIDLTGMAAHS
jgi:hypothetical protein